MATFDLYWPSTSEERYDTDMLAKARQVIETSQATVLEEYGGTDLATGMSDNGFVVQATEVYAAEIARAIGVMIDKDVVVRPASFDEEG